ncbi:hypothetical protein AB5I41_00330 [Sphingomonas sp. MMS24-JH45]
MRRTDHRRRRPRHAPAVLDAAGGGELGQGEHRIQQMVFAELPAMPLLASDAITAAIWRTARWVGQIVFLDRLAAWT